MAEYKPLTKEERANIVQTIGMLDEGVCSKLEYFSDLLRYEATVKDRENRIAALEAENARLREKAELGEAVEAMPVDWMLLHWMERDWLVYKHATFTDWDGMEDWHEIQAENPCDEEGVDRWRGDTVLEALRAAKGEETDHAH